jgi:type I restriction enzyme S subunit
VSRWPVRRLGRVAKTISGSGFPHEYQGRETGEIPVVKVSDLHRDDNASGVSNSANYVSRAEAKILGLRLVPSGSIVFPKVGAALLGNARALTLRDCVLDNNMMAVAPREGDARFWKYALSLVDLGEFSGSGPLPFVSDSQVRDLVIPFPPPDAQRRIADFLDVETERIDRLIGARRRMRELLVAKRERTVERVLGLESGIAMLPLKYMVQSVGVGIVIRPSDWYVDGGGVFALRGLNVRPGRVETADLVQISHDGHRENRKSQILAGDVVVVRTGQAGAAAVVPNEFDGCNCIDLLIIRPGSRVSSQFLAHYINSSYAQRNISEESVGSIQAHFNVSSMKQLDFPSLTIKEQERRAAEVDGSVGDLDALDLQLKKQIDLLSERRQALITAAVTGQIDATTAREFAPRHRSAA